MKAESKKRGSIAGSSAAADAQAFQSDREIGDHVDLASAQSFPASDAPPWTLGVDPLAYRVDRDSMGEVLVPIHALYGAQTQRAVENFRIGGDRFQPSFVRALGLIKACAARANAELGVLPADLAAGIAEVSDRIANGMYFDQFVVDVFQTGSGTSTNMNANEVIARLANAHPNDHVNRSQSSNDVIPSAIHIAAALQISGCNCCPPWNCWRGLENKAQEFWDVSRSGERICRTRPRCDWGRSSAATRIKLKQAANAWRRRWRASTNCRWAERRSARA